MELKGKKINFLGDSITQGCGASCEAATFHAVLAREEGLAAARNYGVSGTRIARQHNFNSEADYDRDYNLRADEMDADADAVVVFGGTNDFGHGDAPLGCFSDRTELTFYGALHVLCAKLAARYDTVVFLTPLHRLTEDAQINEIGIRNCASLEGYVNAITEVTAFYGIPVLDLFRVSGMQPKVDEIRSRLMPDGLHPNDAGHAVIARKLAAFLKTL